MSAEEHPQQPAQPAAVPQVSDDQSRARGRELSGVPMRELLASCAAADAVSTPPSELSDAPDPSAAAHSGRIAADRASNVPEEDGSSGPGESGAPARERDAAA